MTVVVRRLFASLAIITLAGAGTASAQQPASPGTGSPGTAGALKVAFVNSRAVLQGMPGYAKAESTWTKEAAAAQSEAEKLQAAWDTTVATFRQTSAMMSVSARAAKEKSLQAQGDSLQAKLKSLEDKVQNRQQELLTPMQTRLQAIIDGIRAESNYAMVIDLANPNSANIISYDKSLDITDRVLRRLLQSN